jgi:hypothetical protein
MPCPSPEPRMVHQFAERFFSPSFLETTLVEFCKTGRVLRIANPTSGTSPN